MSEGYRGAFQGVGAVSDYERRLFGDGAYGDYIWRQEQIWLGQFIERTFADGRLEDYLDFACGTGRVLAFLAPRCHNATGIDVSEAMLAIARAKSPSAKLLRLDITDPHVPVESHYDLITAFRFVLNAEDSLRRQGLMALRDRLRAPESRLIITVQAATPSFRSLQRPVSRGRRNFLSQNQLLKLIDECGLVAEETYGYDAFSGTVRRIVGAARFEKLDAWSQTTGISSRYGAHRLLVARKL